jgi:pimeloyl-ACP methyl ester carboxylesterase
MLRENFDDPRLLDSIAQSVKNFNEACKLLDSPVIKLLIPHGSAFLPANLFLPKASTEIKGMAPVIVNTGGFDSTQEELYHFTAAGARLRGYATLTFEGPGQGIVLRRDKLFLQPEWELVVKSVLDGLFRESQGHPEWHLDLNRIAIIGNSMGGYFALRGATDPRIKACICSDGVFDMGALGRERSPFFMKYLSDSMVDSLLSFVLRFDFTTRWEIRHGMFALGEVSMSSALHKIAQFTCEPSGRKVLSEITCPVLVTDARDTAYTLGTRQIYEALTKIKEEDKSLWSPDDPGTGSLQAKVAALSHLHWMVCGWLDRVFGVQRPRRE